MATVPVDNCSMSNLPDLAAAVLESKRRKIRNYPQRWNRASEVGHPCERYLVLCRTNWQDRLLHGPELEFIFDGGRMIEDMAIRELQDAGFQIIEQQRAFEWPALELTGHLDAKVVWEGRAYPLEIKGLNHQDAERLNTLRDFLESPKPWIRKYPAQLTMYLLNTNSELGAFYIKDKLTFVPKVVWVELDYDYAEELCKKLERVNTHVKSGTRPDPCDDPEVCRTCAFLHICLPEVKATAIEMPDDEELEAKLLRREELTAAKAEYEALDREIKKALEGKERAIVGDFLVTGKWVERKGYTVEPSRYWQSKIARLVPEQAQQAMM